MKQQRALRVVPPKPAGVIAAEIVGAVFYKPGKHPTEKELRLCLLITEAIAAERRRRP